MRAGHRFVAALAAAGVGTALVAVPALATTVLPSPGTPPPAATATTIPPLIEQVVTTRTATVTPKKVATATTARKRAATTAQRQATTVPTTAAPAPTPPPTVATTVPLPTQGTSLSPVTAPPTTAAPINDATATRVVNRVIMALVGLALLVFLLTLWYWRSTKPVPPSLDGLDLISTNKWLRGKPAKRARLLGDYHARRGPVAPEVIARTNAPTVKVGAAVAAPAVAAVGAPTSASSWGEGASGTLGSLAEDLPGSPPVTDAGDGAAVANGDEEHGILLADSAFTVVARRPRGDGDVGSDDGE